MVARMIYLIENTKTGAHQRCKSLGQAHRWAAAMGWTDYTIQEIAG